MSATSKTKFTGVSPLTTKLLRQRLEFQIRAGEVSVGRTIVAFEMGSNRVDQLLDHLIATEIPGSGATSKEVKRLRDLRTRLRSALAGGDDTGVSMTVPDLAHRDRVLSIIAEAWWIHHAAEWSEALTELSGGGDPSTAEMYAWLDGVL